MLIMGGEHTPTGRRFYDVVHQRYGNPQRFITELRSRMKLHGVSQGKLARVAGYDPANISRWVGDSRNVCPSLEVMLVLDEALDTIIDDLVRKAS